MFKQSRNHGALAVIALCTVLAGCNGDPLKKFVEQDVKLEVKASGSQVQATGKLNFEEVFYTTTYETRCDYYECGGYENRCYGGGTHCSGGHEVCTSGREVCREVQRCTGAGCSTDTVCHTTGGSCHTVGQTCHTEPRECNREYVSRSCRTNCRQEPVQHRHTRDVPSLITVNIKGADAKAVQELHLAVKPGSRFVEAFDNASIRPKGFEYLWDSLSKQDRTILVAGAKGAKLSAGQTFLTLPEGFKAGDPVTIEALFEPNGSTEAKVTAVGSSVDFPALSFQR